MFLVLLAAVVLLSACATAARRDDGGPPPGDTAGANDPFEPFNRAVYVFNDKLDRYLLKPVAKGYRAVIPRFARRGVSNFFGNLHEPAVMVNDALQGKFTDAASDLGRFLTNTTLGVYGLFDVATHFGMEQHNEDFGQTLGVWGVKPGPYLVLPFFGPSDFRDGIGLYADHEMYPPTYMKDRSTAGKLYALEVVNTRARLLEAGDILQQAAGPDPYVFVREAYRQRRQSLIRDGASAAPAPFDPSIFQDDQPAPKKAAPPERPAPPAHPSAHP